MAVAVANTGVSAYVIDGGHDVAWTDAEHVTLIGAQQDSRTREFDMSLSNAFDAIHDGCTIDGITIEFTASIGTSYLGRRCTCQFLTASINATVTSTNTNYSNTVDGTGLTPAMVRGGVIASTCYKDEDFYAAQFTMSLPIITVLYVDNGMPQMLQFTL